MSLRKLSKHQSEASYANSWSWYGDSGKSSKHKQYAINRFHRAVRRTQRETIASQLLEVERTPIVVGLSKENTVSPFTITRSQRTVHCFAV